MQTHQSLKIAQNFSKCWQVAQTFFLLHKATRFYYPALQSWAPCRTTTGVLTTDDVTEARQAPAVFVYPTGITVEKCWNAIQFQRAKVYLHC